MTRSDETMNEETLAELNALRRRVVELEAEHRKHVVVENTLRKNEHRFRVLVEQGTDALLLHDLNGRVVDVNQMTCEALGYSREELLGTPVWSFVEGMPEGGAKEWEQMSSGTTIEDVSVWRRRDGTTFPVEVRVSSVELDGQRLISAVARDVAERQRAETALREGEERFRTIIEEAADAFVMHDLQGKIIDVNRMACEFLGYSRGELLGMPMWEFVVTMPEGGATEWKQMVPGVTLEDASIWRRKDGTTFPVEVRIRAVELNGKQMIFGMCRDVSEREKAEEATRELAVMEERNRLARELHDSVTQSLYSLTLFSEAGRRLADSGDHTRVKDYLTQLGQTSQQALMEMRLLVHELRPMDVELEGLVAALQHRLDAVEGRTGLETCLLVDDAIDLPPSVEDCLYRVAQEALNNSLKHASATSVTVRITASSDHVELQVQDDGRGFDPERLGSLGGMGLSSMRERAEQLGGVLSISSEIGGGTRVSLRAPTA